VIKSDLKRDLNLLSAVAVGLGAIIGAGIFVVSGVAARVAGPGFIIGLLLAGFVALMNALSSAQLAARYPQSGGTYEYGYRLLNPWLGFSAGWMFLASKLAAGGTVALGFAGYLAALFPGTPEKLAAVLAVIFLTGVNYLGIRKAGSLNLIIVTISVFALSFFAAAGISVIERDNFIPFAPAGLPGILQSAALLFFAYTGYARLATLGEEVSEPKKTIPRAIIISLGAASVLYFLVALVAVGSIGTEVMSNTAAPLEQASRTFPFTITPWIVSVGATTAMLGVLLSQLLGISRMMFAMARRGDIPRALDHVHKRFGIPDRGIILTGLILVIVTLFGTLETILSAAAFTILIYYAIANLSALRMEPEDWLFPGWVPVFGLISCLLLALTLPVKTILSGVGLLLVGFLWRLVITRFSRQTEEQSS
jgi:basic amino acid/polyamine antiporter, APA family